MEDPDAKLAIHPCHIPTENDRDAVLHPVPMAMGPPGQPTELPLCHGRAGRLLADGLLVLNEGPAIGASA